MCVFPCSIGICLCVCAHGNTCVCSPAMILVCSWGQEWLNRTHNLLSNNHGSVQLLSHVQLSATPRTAARRASLSITNSQSLLKLTSIEAVMPSNHLINNHGSLLFTQNGYSQHPLPRSQLISPPPSPLRCPGLDDKLCHPLVAQMVKNLPANTGDVGSVPGSGRSPGEGNGNPLQCSPGESRGQRSLAGHNLWGCKEPEVTEQLNALLRRN